MIMVSISSMDIASYDTKQFTILQAFFPSAVIKFS